ncbi:ribokinase [Methylomonas albis]|uniref:Ribokinase n=1 Tax=Methylomonas albis TaxID=1854563 RepID=A0ABR9D299_9GAMM|nr:ribokinase [Methylomonas albis]MBD9357243.1 ribokinase [Methylomonas albis]
MSILVLASYVHAHCLHVQRLPCSGESVQATGILEEHGGKGLNVGLAAHKQGAKVAMLLPLGMDAVADSVITLLRNEGLDDRWLLRTGPQSGFGVGFIGPNGENFLAVYPGANALLNKEHVEQALAALPDLNLIYAQFEIPEAPIRRAFEIARQRGIRTMLNPSPWHQPDHGLLKLTDILVVNETEAAALLGRNDNKISVEHWLNSLSTWSEHIAWSGELLVVTLGEAGCVALTKSLVLHQPAWPVATLDATGAGDAFSAGLATALLNNLSLTEALRLACASGAWVAKHHGVLGCLPTQAEIDHFMKTSPTPKSV